MEGEEDAEATGVFTALAPYFFCLSEPYENPIKATDFCPSRLHVYVHPQYFRAIIGAEGSLQRAHSWSQNKSFWSRGGHALLF
jgi:hypothetical protein